MDRLEYAQHYDRFAPGFYRLAVYLTGNADAAGAALAACFAAGLDGESQSRQDLEAFMVGQLVFICRKFPFYEGERYCGRLKESLSPRLPNERLCAFLGTCRFSQRAIALLWLFGYMDPPRIHKAVGESPQMVHDFLRTMADWLQPSGCARR